MGVYYNVLNYAWQKDLDICIFTVKAHCISETRFIYIGKFTYSILIFIVIQNKWVIKMAK